MFRLFCLFALCSSAFAALPSASDIARSVREAGLDADQCYRVREVSFQKEDLRVYLADGYLIFSKPVAGEPRAAVFTADVEGGDGEMLLLPPTRGERQSLAFFTQSANLDEHFREALFIFTDHSARTLVERIGKDGTGRKAPEMGAVLAEKWASVLSNVESGFQIRMIEDLLAPTPEGGMTFVAVDGRTLGNFDILYDPRSREQIVAGQLGEHNGRLGYNIWTSFPARSARNVASSSAAKTPPAPWFTSSRFRIDAALDTDLKMRADTRVTLRVGGRALRVFPFDISSAMNVTSVKIDGAPAELFSQESLRGRALRGSDNDVFLVISPAALDPGSEHEFEFEHEGAVIAAAGNNVFFVNARANWYPRSAESFADYDLTFRYPKRLTLVTAGQMVDDRTDGDSRVTHWRTPNPIRLAGFNLGDYEKVSGSVPGYTIDVYGNRHLQASLEPRPVAMEPQPPTRRPAIDRMAPPGGPTVIPPDPLARLRAVASDVSSSLEFFTASFGPPALKTLTVAPIPGTFGQGFPGLVYLSTISYLNPNQRPPALRDAGHQFFFSELMEAHEVAHQWWGNVVTVNAYQDQWLLESISSYSALLWLEKKKGPKVVDSILAEYRDHLITKDDQGRTLESAGPITWGGRLESTGNNRAWHAITYEKGAWILHMLRRRLGDERFLKMIAEMRRRYEFKTISTANFQDLVKEFLPPHTSPASVDLFFENWVYATGIPSLKVKYTAKGVAPSVRISGSIAQTGVDDDFSIDVPVEIQFAKGAAQTIWVRTSDDGGTFSATVKQVPAHVVLGNGLLTKGQ